MIVRCTAGQHYMVKDVDGIAHAWMGVPVKRVAGGWAAKVGAKERLVRKAGCTVVA